MLPTSFVKHQEDRIFLERTLQRVEDQEWLISCIIERVFDTVTIVQVASKDYFRLTLADPQPFENLMKQGLASDVDRTYDILPGTKNIIYAR